MRTMDFPQKYIPSVAYCCCGIAVIINNNIDTEEKNLRMSSRLVDIITFGMHLHN